MLSSNFANDIVATRADGDLNDGQTVLFRRLPREALCGKTWHEWQWHMRETGIRLLAWGLAQLWEGMSENERSHVRDRLPRTSKAIGWPVNPKTDPPRYDGPEEIPLPDQGRNFDNYISCPHDYLNDKQKAENTRVEQAHEKFLRRATLAQFVDEAEQAAKALRAMINGDFDTSAEWGDLYTKTFWPLACLRRAHKVPPRESWPAAELEQRKVLADAAEVLFKWVGEVKPDLKPADADEALEQFMESILQLRNASEGQFIERLTVDAARVAKEDQSELANALTLVVGELKSILDDRETSVPGEFVSPEPLRGTPLYAAMQTVESVLGGKLPVDHHAWSSWRTMIWIADEGGGEGGGEEGGEEDELARDNQFYECANTLLKWASAFRLPSAAGTVPQDAQSDALFDIKRWDGYIGGEELKKKLGIHPARANAFEQQLNRKRRDLGDGNWQEVANPAPNMPKYQYRDSQLLRELAEPYMKPK